MQKIERHPAATEMLRRFLFLHVVAHRLPILTGHAVFLTYSDAADHFPKAFVVDPHTIALGAGLWGKTISPPEWVRENTFCIEADIDYSHLTWSMLDPVNGTSERVLDHPKSARVAFTARNVAKSGVVKAHDVATRLALMDQSVWLGRNLHRKAKAGHGSAWRGRPQQPDLAPRQARAQRLYEIASIDLPWPAATQLGGASAFRLAPSPADESARDCYDAISKLNIVDNVAKITRAFYERLGLSPQQSPVYRCLASIRSKLAEEVGVAASQASHRSSLERFERAWRAVRGRQDP